MYINIDKTHLSTIEVRFIYFPRISGSRAIVFDSENHKMTWHEHESWRMLECGREIWTINTTFVAWAEHVPVMWVQQYTAHC